MKEAYDQAVAEVKSLAVDFIAKAEEASTNKGAFIESRKLSVELRHALKTYRAVSVAYQRSLVKRRGPRKPKDESAPAEAPTPPTDVAEGASSATPQDPVTEAAPAPEMPTISV